MVSPVSHRGFRDWLIQRTTAILIGLYAIGLIIYVFNHADMTFATWQQLFSHMWMKIATIIALVSVLWHAWIGLWTVFTDYVKCKKLRLVLEVIVCLLLVFYLIWTLMIVF